MKNPITLAFVGLALIANLSYASKQYSSTVGTQAMFYSGAAYCARATLDDWSCGEPCTSTSGTSEIVRIADDSKDTFAYVGYNSQQNQIIVSFRGTNGADFSNWVTNLKFDQVDYKDVSGAKVHLGFDEAYEAVGSILIDAVRTKISSHSSATILITGHSLGGALATLAALDIKRSINPSNAIHFYTFGSPRVGNQQFSDYVISLFNNGMYSRVVHYDDMVPHVPLESQGFNHAGNEVWYKNEGDDLTFQECENYVGKVENQACSDSFFLNTGIDAHLHYLAHPISGMCTSKDSNELPTNSTVPTMEVKPEGELFLVE